MNQVGHLGLRLVFASCYQIITVGTKLIHTCLVEKRNILTGEIRQTFGNIKGMADSQQLIGIRDRLSVCPFSECGLAYIYAVGL